MKMKVLSVGAGPAAPNSTHERWTNTGRGAATAVPYPPNRRSFISLKAIKLGQTGQIDLHCTTTSVIQLGRPESSIFRAGHGVHSGLEWLTNLVDY